MTISREDVEHVARLARLKLTEEEILLFGQQLDSILNHIQKLREVDVSAISPTAQVIPVMNGMREDQPRPSLSQESVLANASREEDGYFRVPPVFDEL